MKKIFLFFFPLCAMADFTSSDSTHLLETSTATQQTADRLNTANYYLNDIEISNQSILENLQYLFNAYIQYTNYGQYYSDSLTHSLYSYNLLRQGFSTPSVNYLFLADTDVPTTSSSAIASTSNQSLSQYFNLLFGVLSTLNNSQTANAVDIAKRIRDVRICASTLTNLVADVRTVNRGISNVVDIIYQDHRRYHDVITNLWASTFKFPQPASASRIEYWTRSYGTQFGNIGLLDQTKPSSVYSTVSPMSSLTELLVNNFISLRTGIKWITKNQTDNTTALVAIYNAITNIKFSASNSFDRSYSSSSTFQWGYALANSSIPIEKLDDNAFVKLGTELSGDFFQDVVALQKTRLKQEETTQLILSGIFNNTAPTNMPDESTLSYEFKDDADEIKEEQQQVVHDWAVDFGSIDIDAFDGFKEYNFSQLPAKVFLDFTELLDDYQFFKQFDQSLQNQMRVEFDPRDYLWFFQLIRGCSICVIILSCVHMFGIALRFFYNVIYFAFFSHPHDN